MSENTFNDKGSGRRPMYESGDQDYSSMVGWQPGPTAKQLLEADKKKNPRAYAPEPNMLFTRQASEWMSGSLCPAPDEPLFGPMWRVNELAILFATTGLGKSALATQIAESIARGIPIAPFNKDEQQPMRPRKVLYLDFELSREQFAMRYSCIGVDGAAYQHPYDFSPEFKRSEMFWDGQVIEGYDSFSDMFFRNIYNEIVAHEAEVLIVDNITYLDRGPTSNANIATSIMRELNELKRNHFLSILVIAHTPKRKPWLPLTERDLQGSINLANFADSMFAIGASRHSTDWRYVKQIKVRSGRPEFDATRVVVFSLEKLDQGVALGVVQDLERESITNFLGFRFVKIQAESEHTDFLHQPIRAKPTSRVKANRSVIETVKRLTAKGKSVGAVAAELGIPKSTVFRYTKKKVSDVL